MIHSHGLLKHLRHKLEDPGNKWVMAQTLYLLSWESQAKCHWNLATRIPLDIREGTLYQSLDVLGTPGQRQSSGEIDTGSKWTQYWQGHTQGKASIGSWTLEGPSKGATSIYNLTWQKTQGYNWLLGGQELIRMSLMVKDSKHFFFHIYVGHVCVFF